MSLYCHGSPECGPVVKSPEFSLLHNQAAAAQTWGLSATASIGKATATAATYTSSTSSSASSLTAKKTAAGSASAAVTGTATPQASGGLSAGAKAGIGIGVALSAVAVVAALWFCVMRARRRGRLRGTAPDGFGTPEMMGEQRYSTHQGWMGPTRHEMSGEAKMNELQGTPQAELSSVASPVRYG